METPHWPHTWATYWPEMETEKHDRTTLPLYWTSKYHRGVRSDPYRLLGVTDQTDNLQSGGLRGSQAVKQGEHNIWSTIQYNERRPSEPIRWRAGRPRARRSASNLIHGTRKNKRRIASHVRWDHEKQQEKTEHDAEERSSGWTVDSLWQWRQWKTSLQQGAQIRHSSSISCTCSDRCGAQPEHLREKEEEKPEKRTWTAGRPEAHPAEPVASLLVELGAASCVEIFPVLSGSKLRRRGRRPRVRAQGERRAKEVGGAVRAGK
jgi:hypothetical protein